MATWRSDVSCVYTQTLLSQKLVENVPQVCFGEQGCIKTPKKNGPKRIVTSIWPLLIFVLPEWWYAPVAYLFALGISGVVYSKSRLSSVIGIPVCLMMLHTAFTIGMFDGLIRSGKASSDRT